MARPCRFAAARVAVLFAAWLLPGVTRADFFSQSPGPLAEGHKAVEGAGQCEKCHTGGRSLDNAKCLACHQPVAKRIEAGRGFHASERVAGKPCYLCHTDHKGRGRDILGFAAIGGRDKFDHAQTGWPLRQKHAAVACATCHTGRSFLRAPATCDGCHKQPHGELRAALRRCERCHDAGSWRPIDPLAFDHDRPAETRFVLDGKHAGVPCAKCHEKGLFRPPGAAVPDCAPCHQNPHGDSLFGTRKCVLCHTAKVAFTTAKFDHAHRTRFPLEGAHATAACAKCHPPQAKAKPDRACTSCHKGPHRDRFAAIPDCGACHGADSFRAGFRFDHAGRTGVPLTGKHGEVACRRCHRGDGPLAFERLPAEVGCMGCHQHANVHKRQFTDADCLRCHKAAGVNKFKRAAIVQFHGEGSRFPLSEGHAGVRCERCHKNDVYQGVPMVCGPACHADALHRGALGGECGRCHEGAHWAATRFEHDQTSYPLLGHHEQADCEGCHAGRRFRPTPRNCAACHGAADAHQGTLGARCERCHSPTGRSLFDHNDPREPDRFRLDGKHVGLRCRACHPTTVFRTRKTRCEDCHDDPVIHRGRYGTECAGCHDASSWGAIHTSHDRAGFRFGGAHDRLPCASCHEGGQKRRGTGELCLACHQGDDTHHGGLGPRCGECHTQEAFAPARFFHERVGCDLRGAHRTLPCNDCHTGGHFASVSPSCGSCHRADAVRGMANRNAPPGHAGFTTCAPCHNVNFFVPSRPSGSESVCR